MPCWRLLTPCQAVQKKSLASVYVFVCVYPSDLNMFLLPRCVANILTDTKHPELSMRWRKCPYHAERKPVWSPYSPSAVIQMVHRKTLDCIQFRNPLRKNCKFPCEIKMHSFMCFLLSNHCNGLLNLFDTILDSCDMNNIDAETNVVGYANNLSHLYEISCFYELVFHLGETDNIISQTHSYSRSGPLECHVETRPWLIQCLKETELLDIVKLVLFFQRKITTDIYITDHLISLKVNDRSIDEKAISPSLVNGLKAQSCYPDWCL